MHFTLRLVVVLGSVVLGCSSNKSDGRAVDAPSGPFDDTRVVEDSIVAPGLDAPPPGDVDLGTAGTYAILAGELR